MSPAQSGLTDQFHSRDHGLTPVAISYRAFGADFAIPMATISEIISSYNPAAPLAEASTIPASWYTDERVYELEKQTAFSESWQVAARVDQLAKPGDYVTTEIAGEPIVIVRGHDDQIRAFFNVCRHHAAAVMTEPEGQANQMRCPYHGWTYRWKAS